MARAGAADSDDSALAAGVAHTGEKPEGPAIGARPARVDAPATPSAAMPDRAAALDSAATAADGAKPSPTPTLRTWDIGRATDWPAASAWTRPPRPAGIATRGPALGAKLFAAAAS